MKRTDKLDEVLKRVAVPARPPGYWEFFPRRVTARLREDDRKAPATSPVTIAWAFASAVVMGGLLLIGLSKDPVRLAQRQPAAADAELHNPRKVYREMAVLFPEQLNAIVADDQGVRVVLADHPSKPSSPPLFLKVCARNGCEEIITFSGQQVPVNGDACEVLLDGKGNVVLVGPRMYWSSAENGDNRGDLSIWARRLDS